MDVQTSCKPWKVCYYFPSYILCYVIKVSNLFKFWHPKTPRFLFGYVYYSLYQFILNNLMYTEFDSCIIILKSG